MLTQEPTRSMTKEMHPSSETVKAKTSRQQHNLSQQFTPTHTMTSNHDDTNHKEQEEDDTRHKNDTTMPPPQVSKTNQNHNPTHTAPRHKTALRKGFGLADWNKLLHTAADLAQLRGQPLQRYRWSDIKQHGAPHDGWVVLRGKVYRVSPYLPYHPGGEAILRKVLGKDITALYDKYHRWVNEQGCVVILLLLFLFLTVVLVLILLLFCELHSLSMEQTITTV